MYVISKYIENIDVVIVQMFLSFRLHNFDNLRENEADFH